MLARTLTHTLVGLEPRRVEVEAHLQRGVPAFAIVGLADRACQEAKERVRSGIASAELEWPVRRITVNLAPADLRKEGPAFDLPIALAVGGPLSGLILQLQDPLGLASWRWLFLLEGAPAVLLGVVAFFYLPAGPASAAWLTPAERVAIAERLAQDHDVEAAALAAGNPFKAQFFAVVGEELGGADFRHSVAIR